MAPVIGMGRGWFEVRMNEPAVDFVNGHDFTFLVCWFTEIRSEFLPTKE